MTFQLLRDSASGQLLLRWPRLGVGEFLTPGSIYFSKLSPHIFLVCLFFLFHYEVIKLHHPNAVQGGNAFFSGPVGHPASAERGCQTMGISRCCGVLSGSPPAPHLLQKKKRKEKIEKNKPEAVG